jgi:hypothetical protein
LLAGAYSQFIAGPVRFSFKVYRPQIKVPLQVMQAAFALAAHFGYITRVEWIFISSV